MKRRTAQNEARRAKGVGKTLLREAREHASGERKRRITAEKKLRALQEIAGKLLTHCDHEEGAARVDGLIPLLAELRAAHADTEPREGD
jgi:hypothetical protein